MKRVVNGDSFQIDGLILPINTTVKSGCFVEVLEAIYGEMSAMLNRHCKVLAFRMDFHLYEYTDTNKAISNLMRKVRKHLKRRFNEITFSFVWVREVEKAKRQHYHVWFMLDGSKVRVTHNVIPICENIWEGWGYPKPYTPKNCYYLIKRGDDDKFSAAFYRASYLAKVRGKGYKASKANDFSSSRLRFIDKSLWRPQLTYN